MLRKVLKYDLLSCLKLWLIVACASMPIALLGGACSRIMVPANMDPSGMQMIVSIAVIGILVGALAIIAFVIFSYILPLYRTYKNMFTDEAYLTFTLPVSREVTLFSKLLTSVIYDIASTVVLVIDLILFLAPMPALEDGTGSVLSEIFASIGTMLSALHTAIGGWLVVFIILFIILGIVSISFSKMLIVGIMSFVCTIQTKHKVLFGVLIYYGISTVSSMISSTLMVVLELGAMSINANADLYGTGTLCAMIMLALIVAICAYVILVGFAYKFSLHRISNKLNLA